jgi:hypothetical protein
VCYNSPREAGSGNGGSDGKSTQRSEQGLYRHWPNITADPSGLLSPDKEGWPWAGV